MITYSKLTKNRGALLAIKKGVFSTCYITTSTRGVFLMEQNLVIETAVIERILKENHKLIEQNNREYKEFEIIKKVREKIKDPFTIAILSSIFNENDITFNDLIKKLKADPEQTEIFTADLVYLNLIHREFRGNSPLEKHFSLTEFGNNILINVFNLNKTKADQWIKGYGGDNMKESLIAIIP